MYQREEHENTYIHKCTMQHTTVGNALLYVHMSSDDGAIPVEVGGVNNIHSCTLVQSLFRCFHGY